MRLAGLLFWLFAFLAQPASAQTASKLPMLEQRLAAMAVENPGEYGIAALDLATGRTVSFNGIVVQAWERESQRSRAGMLH